MPRDGAPSRCRCQRHQGLALGAWRGAASAVALALGLLAPASAGPTADATDTVAFPVPLPDEHRPVVTLVRTLTRDGRAAHLCTVLGPAGVRPVPVAGRVLVEARPLVVGKDEQRVPDPMGRAIGEETTWAVPVAGGEAAGLPLPAFPSPSGAQVAYWRGGGEPGRRLWVRSAQGERAMPLYWAGDTGDVQCVDWSPDGRYLAATAFPAASRRGQQVTIADAQTGTVVFERLRGGSARWSPDGRMLAYLHLAEDVSQRGPWEMEVWVRETGQFAFVARVPTGRGVACPVLRWAPDGQRILCEACRAGPGQASHSELWLLAREGGEARCVYEADLLDLNLLAWTEKGDGFWQRRYGEAPSLLLLPPGAEKARPSAAPDAKGPRLGPEELAAVEQAAETARGALRCVARARQAVDALCADLQAPRRELAQAAEVLRGLSQAHPRARLIPAQCRAYADALAGETADLPIAACLVRMRRLAGHLVDYFLKHGMLPPAPPAGPEMDPRCCVSPGLRRGEEYRVRYLAASGGRPRRDAVVLECGPIGDRVVRLRWPDSVREGRYVRMPGPAVEPVMR